MFERGPTKHNTRFFKWQRYMEDNAPWEYVVHGFKSEKYAGPGLLDKYHLKNWVRLRNSQGIHILVGEKQAKDYAGIIVSFEHPERLPENPNPEGLENLEI